ncbi:hypothetical protein ACJJTC_009016, partial [Scirpophaga incertulas]
SYSAMLERPCNVNPGRKASLSGIREGDIISSINGRTTKGMSNSEAHAMLRSAGPILKLGLNENREMSPRRRSIGKGSDLKRPSQLISEVQSGKAVPQAPVYATIRPSQLPQSRPASLSTQSSLNSLPTSLNSTSLVKSVNDELPQIHPTNPFYTTLPNYSSPSKLPVPNGKTSFDRSKSKDNTLVVNDHDSDLKSPSFFNKIYDSGPSDLQHSNYKDAGLPNCCDSGNYGNRTKSENSLDSSDYNTNSVNISHDIKITSNNPFETKRNSDPFEKYLHPENKFNGKTDFESSTLTNSISDNNFQRKEEITKRSTITEHEINEIEEVKTVKKIVLNGSGGITCDNERSLSMKLFEPGESTTTKLEQENHSSKVYNIPIYKENGEDNTSPLKSDSENRSYKKSLISTENTNSTS